MGFWENAKSVMEVIRDGMEAYDHGQRMANVILGDIAVEGRLQLPGVSEVVPIVIPRHGTYLFTLTQPLLTDFDLAILNSQGEVVAADTSMLNPSQVIVEGQGMCFAVVHAAAGYGDYTLSARLL